MFCSVQKNHTHHTPPFFWWDSFFSEVCVANQNSRIFLKMCHIVHDTFILQAFFYEYDKVAKHERLRVIL